jgi:flavin-dependent dehydrogenase
VLNFFPLGDSFIRTNPLYGRGCTFAAIEAETLVHAFDRTENPVARATLYFNNARGALRPYYSDMVKQDKAAIRRARNALDPDYRPKLRNRVIRSFAEDAITPALRGDTALLREFMRAFHMIDKPSEFLRNPGNIAKIMGVWARGKKRNARHYPPKLGPDRQEMMALLDLPATSDWERLRDAA